MNKTIDLHVHSLFSDGKKSIEEIIDIANINGVGYLSFTEHYNISSYNITKSIDCKGIEIIPGIEIGTDMSIIGYCGKKHKCHIVVYYPSDEICLLLDKYEENREHAIEKMLKLLNKNQNIKISYSQVEEYARDANHITRYDLAVALAKLGFAQEPLTAYGQYLDYNGKCFVSRKKETPQGFIKHIKEIGGVAVLAHPKSLSLSVENEYKFITDLVIAGLDGIEVYNPYNAYEIRKRYLSYCKDFDLIPTVGSDFHGLPNRYEEIGKGLNNNLNITDLSIINKIKERAKI